MNLFYKQINILLVSAMFFCIFNVDVKAEPTFGQMIGGGVAGTAAGIVTTVVPGIATTYYAYQKHGATGMAMSSIFSLAGMYYFFLPTIKYAYAAMINDTQQKDTNAKLIQSRLAAPLTAGITLGGLSALSFFFTKQEYLLTPPAIFFSALSFFPLTYLYACLFNPSKQSELLLSNINKCYTKRV